MLRDFPKFNSKMEQNLPKMVINILQLLFGETFMIKYFFANFRKK